MSWSTSLLLAAVLWMDGGLRRIPSDSIVMRRSLFGPWRFGEIVRAGKWHAVARWPSVIVALLTSEPTRITLSGKQLSARLESVRTQVLLLRAVGVLATLVLVIGAPLAASRMGRTGLYAVGACLFVLGVVTAIVSHLASRRLGDDVRKSVRFASTFLWPFATPHASERVLALAVAGGSPVEVLRVLVGHETFARWARPWAYDALMRDSSHNLGIIDGFDFRLERRKVGELLSVLPQQTSSHARLCPRCGGQFQTSIRACADCGGLELTTSHDIASLFGQPLATRDAPARGGVRNLRRRRRRRH